MRRRVQISSAAFRLSRFSKPYRQRLLAGLLDLDGYCRKHGPYSLAELLGNLNIADEVLSLYVMQRHGSLEQKQLYVVKHALLCCQLSTCAAEAEGQNQYSLGKPSSLGRAADKQTSSSSTYSLAASDDRPG